uniref:(northern house mosquito) hypothetical protein n=1 Tax=Culex pipiens TaxID=7175 RepID=A0A8D8BTV1_CULPI
MWTNNQKTMTKKRCCESSFQGHFIPATIGIPSTLSVVFFSRFPVNLAPTANNNNYLTNITQTFVQQNATHTVDTEHGENKISRRPYNSGLRWEMILPFLPSSDTELAAVDFALRR